MPALLRPTSELSTFYYVGPAYPLSKRSQVSKETKPLFNAVITFMSTLSADSGNLIKPLCIDLV
jgi:hypothetical protein